jgi:DNA replication protein DnaC
MLAVMAQSDCPVCGGTGWRLVDRVDANQPAERIVERKNATHGPSSAAPRFTWAVPCECTGGDRVLRALVRARIPHRYEHCDFENFDTDLWGGSPEAITWNRSLAQARVVIEAFARDYPASAETGLLLMGPCGVGKTHLAVATLRQLMLRGHRVRFYDYRELLKDIQASYNPDHPISELAVLEPVLEAEVLLLDDLGASKPSPWALETISHILNKRYNDKRITLLTTNYLDDVETPSTPARLPSGQTIAAAREETLTDRIGQRVRSRLYEMCRTVEISSADYRREIRQAGRLRS